jgi:phosphoglycerate-specific signal transduction histidine kinase
MNLIQLQQRKQQIDALKRIVKQLEHQLEEELYADATEPRDLKQQINDKIGSVGIAASIIGVSRATLYRWLNDGFPKDERAKLQTLINTLDVSTDAASA